MKKFKLALLMVLAVAGFNSCSSDDEKKSNVIEGGTVFTSQLVAISTENLSQDIYEGIFNDAPVQLANNDSGGLVFFVQPDLALVGEKNILEIPALKMKINYTVKQTVLPGTPEEALAPLFDNIDKLDTSGFAEGEKVNGFLDGFKSYYASLSEPEKTNIAEFYHANLDLFFLTMQNLAQPKGFLGLTNCETAVWVFLTSASAAVILFNPAALGPSIVAMVVAISSLVVGVRECDLFRMQEIKQIFAKFGDLESSRPGKSQEVSRGQAKGMGGALKFVHGEPKGFEAVNVRRSLQASDVADTNPIIAKFFSLVEALNNFVVEKVNVALEYYNSKVPSFFEKELLEKPIVMPENGKVGNEAFDQEVFDAFTFSVGSSDVGLSSISFANGKVNMTFNMADPNAGEISTTLDYVFKDEFNEREGSFPIVVHLEEQFVYEGVWTIQYYVASDGSLFQEDRITFDAYGNSTFYESRILAHPTDNDWNEVPEPWTIEYSNNILKLTNHTWGTNQYYTVESIYDTVFYPSTPDWNTVLIRG